MTSSRARIQLQFQKHSLYWADPPAEPWYHPDCLPALGGRLSPSLPLSSSYSLSGSFNSTEVFSKFLNNCNDQPKYYHDVLCQFWGWEVKVKPSSVCRQQKERGSGKGRGGEAGGERLGWAVCLPVQSYTLLRNYHGKVFVSHFNLEMTDLEFN